MIVIHLYVKEVNKNLLDVILYEDELQVKFATRWDYVVFLEGFSFKSRSVTCTNKNIVTFQPEL